MADGKNHWIDGHQWPATHIRAIATRMHESIIIDQAFVMIMRTWWQADGLCASLHKAPSTFLQKKEIKRKFHRVMESARLKLAGVPETLTFQSSLG